MQAVLEHNRAAELITTQSENAFGQKIGIFGKLFGCWHKQLSRPFSNKNVAYRTCLDCGALKRFDAQNLKTYGPFYYPPIVSSEEK